MSCICASAPGADVPESAVTRHGVSVAPGSPFGSGAGARLVAVLRLLAGPVVRLHRYRNLRNAMMVQALSGPAGRRGKPGGGTAQ